MSKTPKDPKSVAENFINRTNEHHSNEAIRICNELLAVLIKEEVPVLASHRLMARAKEILEKKLKKVSFKNEVINRERRFFLTKTIQDVKNEYIRLEDIDEAGNKPDEWDKKVEPLAQMVVDNILDEKLLFSDDNYLEEALANDDELLLGFISMGYLDASYDKLLTAIQFNEGKANARKWGKEKELITWMDFQRTLEKPEV